MKKMICALVFLGAMMLTIVSAGAEGDIIFLEDFDEYTWTTSSKASVDNGWVTFDTSTGGVTVDKQVECNANNVGEITIEYKWRFEDGAENITDSYSLPRIVGKSAISDNEVIYIGGIYMKKFLFYHKDGNVAGAALKPNVDYIVKSTLNYSKNTFDVAIYEDGNETPVQTHTNMKPREIKDLTSLKINKITLDIPKGIILKVDYIKISSTGLALKKVTPDLSKKIRTDSSIFLEFSHELDEESLSGIKVLTENNENVLLEIRKDKENKKKYEIYFKGGLEYESKYTLLINDEVKSVTDKKFGGYEKNFNTEWFPFSIDSVLYYDENNKKVSANSIKGVNTLTNSIFISNSTGKEKDITVLNVIYSENGKLLKLCNSKVTVEKTDKKYTVDINLSDISNASTVKTYIWDSLEGMIKVGK